MDHTEIVARQTKLAAIAEASEQRKSDEEKERADQLLRERLQKVCRSAICQTSTMASG
jgi:hypothetical protein